MQVFIRFFFILTALVYLVKAESSLYAPIQLCYYSYPTEIELVVSSEPEYGLSFQETGAHPQQITVSTHAQIDFSAIYKSALFIYDRYVLQQLKSFNQTFTLRHRLTSVLQKSNIWHRSSDEDSLLLG